MLRRGFYQDTLTLLSAYRGSSHDDGFVEKLAIEAVALTREQRTQVAAQRLIQAETICSAVDLASCGNVLTARAILTAKLGQFTLAKQSFLRALDFARSHRDPWLEAGTTLNLGYTAMQVDHYDEAVDWSKRAYQQAISLGYENVAQIARLTSESAEDAQLSTNTCDRLSELAVTLKQIVNQFSFRQIISAGAEA